MRRCCFCFFFFQAEDGIRDFCLSRGLGDVYKRQLMDHVMERLRGKLKRMPDFSGASCDAERAGALKRELAALYSPEGKADLLCNKEILSFVSSRHAFAPLSAAFTPDHIVYCKAEFLYTESPELMDVKFQEFMDKKGYAPKIV